MNHPHGCAFCQKEWLCAARPCRMAYLTAACYRCNREPIGIKEADA